MAVFRDERSVFPRPETQESWLVHFFAAVEMVPLAFAALGPVSDGWHEGLGARKAASRWPGTVVVLVSLWG